MTGLLLLLTIIAVTWLAAWSGREDGQGGWSPFDMREPTPPAPPPAPAPARRRARASVPPRERPWKRSGY
jgi:hypothetical protein